MLHKLHKDMAAVLEAVYALVASSYFCDTSTVRSSALGFMRRRTVQQLGQLQECAAHTQLRRLRARLVKTASPYLPIFESRPLLAPAGCSPILLVASYGVNVDI